MTALQKLYIIFQLCLISLFISGCAEVPAEVKGDIAKIKASQREKQEFSQSVTTKSLTELGEDAREDCSIDMGVLQFQGDIIIPNCENVYFLEMKVNDEIYKNIESNMPLLMQYAGVEGKDWKEYITQEKGADSISSGGSIEDKMYDSRGYCFVDINNINFSINHIGWVSIIQSLEREKHPHFLNWDGVITDTYYFINNKEKNLDVEIELNGEKVSLRELYLNFEEGVDLINQCSPGLSLIPHDARIVEEKGTGSRMIVYRALNNYKGVCFDSNYIYPQNSQITGGKSFVGYEMNQHIHAAGDNCNIALRESSYIVIDEMKKYSKVLDFDSALRIIENTIPGDKITILESAELLYQIFYEGEEGQRWEYKYEEPPSFYAAPVWKFVEKDRPNETKATTYYVDAITGEVYSFYKACTP